MKVAACVIMRNEVSDIGSWLAWYHVLGFDACIVYDDDSTDGTRDVVAAAAKVQDIRLYRSFGERAARHSTRQDRSYRHAIETFRVEFDWIGFFDADEYLRLMDCATIHEFLRRFPAGGAVSINWCCYGSSGHVLKPTLPPVEAYTWHSRPTAYINRHVKTLLHLASWTGNYINMHGFEVAPDKAVDPAGVPLRWTETYGIADALPDWSVAKIMHYQCRSMEHFIERLKRTPSLPRSTATWTALDLNDIEDKVPAPLSDAARKHAASFRIETGRLAGSPGAGISLPASAGERDRGLIVDVGVAEGNDSAFYLAKGFRVIGVEADPQACEVLRRRFSAEIKQGKFKLLNYAVANQFGETATIFVHNVHQGISGIAKRSEVPDDYKSFQVPTIDWRTLLVQEGMPRYVKIDVEGSEAPFIESMVRDGQSPEFMSVECYSFAPVEMLNRMGYTRFKIVDQNPAGGFRLPPQQMEGDAIEWGDFRHSSGPFGLDLFQDGCWEDFVQIRASWEAAAKLMHRTWFDCHVWQPRSETSA